MEGVGKKLDNWSACRTGFWECVAAGAAGMILLGLLDSKASSAGMGFGLAKITGLTLCFCFELVQSGIGLSEATTT